MRQALLLFLTAFCVVGLLTTLLLSGYASKDVRRLTTMALNESPDEIERHNRVLKVQQRALRFSDYYSNVLSAGWMVAIGALLYSLRLLRRFERIADQNATLKADLEEKNVAEQVAASDR
ncbi:MAG: hypothetical protein H7A51_13645 [Akkermansiaceae bacterium]|nr:hypothetical protein [Akkermansiaceae bacterium]